MFKASGARGAIKLVLGGLGKRWQKCSLISVPKARARPGGQCRSPADIGQLLPAACGAPSWSCPSLPHLPFQIIKAYLDYALHEQLASQNNTWYKNEIMAMEIILNLPLKAEGIEIMAYMADTLGCNKYLMGHLDLAIDLGKGWLSQTGHPDISNTQKSTGIVFSSGSRAQKMWALLRNPYKQYKVLCWLSTSLRLKTRYLS